MFLSIQQYTAILIQQNCGGWDFKPYFPLNIGGQMTALDALVQFLTDVRAMKL